MWEVLALPPVLIGRERSHLKEFRRFQKFSVSGTCHTPGALEILDLPELPRSLKPDYHLLKSGIFYPCLPD
jgi:hypothetical protein